MRPTLIASILLNIGLAGAVIWLAQNQRPRPPGTETAAAPAAPVASSRPIAPAAETPAPALAVEPQKAAQPFDWRLVESEDYKKYIANLRAIGCPEETIRDIITADVNKLFESRRRETTSPTNKFQFWKTGNVFGDFMNPERIEKTQALTKEKRALLKELLGVEPEEKFDVLMGMNPFETMLDFLPSNKQNEVLELYTKSQAKMASAVRGGSIDAEDMKQMQKAQKDLEAEIAAIMTPEQFQDFQLRMSQTAMMMRSQLAGFDPSEQEFREIFAVKKKFDDEFGMYGMASGDKAERDKYTAAQKETTDQLKKLLGDTRYAEYERSQDYAYQTISRVAERQGLPKESAVKVYEMKKIAEDEANKIRRDSSLTPDQRTTALKEIRDETERSMQTVLGPKGFDAYNKPNNTFWLQNISPKAEEARPGTGFQRIDTLR